MLTFLLYYLLLGSGFSLFFMMRVWLASREPDAQEAPELNVYGILLLILGWPWWVYRCWTLAFGVDAEGEEKRDVL